MFVKTLMNLKFRLFRLCVNSRLKMCACRLITENGLKRHRRSNSKLLCGIVNSECKRSYNLVYCVAYARITAIPSSLTHVPCNVYTHHSHTRPTINQIAHIVNLSGVQKIRNFLNPKLLR